MKQYSIQTKPGKNLNEILSWCEQQGWKSIRDYGWFSHSPSLPHAVKTFQFGDEQKCVMFALRWS
jgi:hypothetical protein